uniref:Uncharacterized protein n=1 Tax=Arundo donax TaxID=35708 RepID=A0A0A8XRB1_ARUDO
MQPKKKKVPQTFHPFRLKKLASAFFRNSRAPIHGKPQPFHPQEFTMTGQRTKQPHKKKNGREIICLLSATSSEKSSDNL